MRTRKPKDIPLEMPTRTWRKKEEVEAAECPAAVHVHAKTVPPQPLRCRHRDDDAQETPLTDEHRAIWNTVVPNPEIPIAEYLEHEKALQEYEGKKLNRLEIMTWAQRTRARFLSLSMADRKIFLDVLTADEGGAMAHMFALQAKLEAEGVDDAQLKLTKTVTKALKPGGRIDDAIAPVKKALREQKRNVQREQKMLTAGSRTALPPDRALALPGGKA